jgi:uncharacterized RDD family membrane protein YckC
MSDTPVSTSGPSYVGFWARLLGFVVDSIWATILIALILGVVLSAPEIDLRAASDPDRADAKTLGKPSTGQLIGRYLAYYVSTLPLCLGFLWVAFDKRKQGWHDRIAGTLVIKR